MNDIDDQIRAMARDAFAPTQHAEDTAGALQPRMRRARRRRRALTTGSTTVLLLLGITGTAVALSGGGGRSAPGIVRDRGRIDPATRPDRSPEGSSVPPSIPTGVPNSAGASNTDAAPDEPPSGALVDADVPPRGRTADPPAAGSDAVPDDAPGPAPTVAPATAGPTVAPAPASGPPVPAGPDPAPTTTMTTAPWATARTLSSSCGSITFRVEGSNVTLISTDAGPRYAVDVKSAGPEKVEVGFEAPTGHCELKAEIDDGRLDTDVAEE